MKSTRLGSVLLALALALAAFEIGATGATAGSAAPNAQGRFQSILLHPSAGSEWSGILDTQTGCVWVYASEQVPAKPSTPGELLTAERGANYFGIVAFDPMDYVQLTIGADKEPDFSPALAGINQETRACSAIRRSAMGLGGSR